jgi:hypothetical protein
MRPAAAPQGVRPVDDEPPALSPDEKAGIEAALESYRHGRVVEAKRARHIIDTAQTPLSRGTLQRKPSGL